MRIRRKPVIEDEENLNRWLLTYSDMISLLLALFVVLYSMAKIDATKFQSLQNELIGVFDPNSNRYVAYVHPDKPPDQLPNRLNQFQRSGKDIVLSARKDFPDVDIDVLFNERGMTVRLPNAMLFAPGSAALTTEAKDLLKKIAPMLEGFDRPVAVEGHTDDTPIATALFPSNWELSTRRAVEVTRYLAEECDIDPERLRATGFGPHQPIADNDTPEGRNANRRVEIILLFNKAEQNAFEAFARLQPGEAPEGYAFPMEIPANQD